MQLCVLTNVDHSPYDAAMKVDEIKVMAKTLNVPIGKRRKKELIQAIQTAEGNAPCFDTGIINCGLTDCLWYDDCQR